MRREYSTHLHGKKKSIFIILSNFILSCRQIGSLFLSHASLCQGSKVHICFTKLWESGLREKGERRKKFCKQSILDWSCEWDTGYFGRCSYNVLLQRGERRACTESTAHHHSMHVAHFCCSTRSDGDYSEWTQGEPFCHQPCRMADRIPWLLYM